MTKRKAYKLSRGKWLEIIKRLENPTKIHILGIYNDVRKLKKYKDLVNGCAYCELYQSFILGTGTDRIVCDSQCPVNLDGTTCLNKAHPYSKFTEVAKTNDFKGALIYAKEILALIEKTKP